MESRIDVIRSGFRGAHNDATPPQSSQQRQRRRGLSGAGMRRGDDEPPRFHLRCRRPPNASRPSSSCAPVMTMAVSGTKGWRMERQERPLRRGWTTGTCATAAAKAAFSALVTGEFPDPVEVTLPRGERPSFALALTRQEGKFRNRRGDQGCRRRSRRHPWRADRGDGALGAPGAGVSFAPATGVGTVTRPGLPLPPGEPAINPVPRRMIRDAIAEVAAAARPCCAT